MEFKNILSKIMCRICKEQFKEPKALFKHLQQKHDTGPAVKNQRTCSICGVQCAKNEAYREHMLHIHGLRTEPQKLTFKNLNDFLLWKVELEKKFNCQYVLQSAPKLLPTNERKYFYQCDRAGQDRPKSREKRITTITKKSCPSVILVLEGTGILKVEYWDNHVGHSRNLDSGHGDELTSAISTLEMMQNMDSQDFDDSLVENFEYNTDFDSSSSLSKSLKRSPRKKGKTTTSNLTSSQNVIRTFYSPSNSGVAQKKPASSVLFSLASVACGKINKNIISEKKIISPPNMETVSSKKISSISGNNKPSTMNSSKNDTSIASTSKVSAPSASSSTTCVTTSESSVSAVPSSAVSTTSREKTATSSSVNEVIPINEATVLSSPVNNDSSSAVSDIRASSPIDDIDTSSLVDEIDKPLPDITTTSDQESASSNKMATSSSKTVSLAQLSATVSVSSSTTSSTKQVSSSQNSTNATLSNNFTKAMSSNEVTKTTSSVTNVTKASAPSHTAGTTSSSSITTKSSAPFNVKTSSPSITSVAPSPISNLVLGTNIKNPTTPLILSNPASNQFYVLGPALGAQSNFGTNLSNVILCPAGQNIIAPNTIVNPTVPTTLKNNIENRKRKAETESPSHNSPNVKKKPSTQEVVRSPASGSVSTAARILNSIGGNQLLTNYIGPPQSSVACMSNNANNKIVLSNLPPMSFVNINNQLIPISTAGTPLSVGSASVPIGQPAVAFNLPTTKNTSAVNAVKNSDLNSIESENDASFSLAPKPLNPISVVASSPISKPTVQVYGRTVVREGESNPSRPISTSSSILKSSPVVDHGYSNTKKKLVRTKLESISNASTPQKGKVGKPTTSLTVSPIKTSDQSVIARTISSIVQENVSTTSIAGFNSINSTLSKVISVASQIAKTVASSKNLPPSTSNVPKTSAKAKSKTSTSKTFQKKGTDVPSIVIPSIPSDSEHSRSFVFESAGDVYMLQPVENDESKTGDQKLTEIVKVKNRAISVQTVPSAKYSYSNTSLKSSISPEKTNLKDDSEILKKVKYYQLEMNYLSSQEECKRLKVELAKTKLKNKEYAEKLGIEMQPSASTNHMDNQKESCVQAEELVKAFEKRCDQDSNVYTLVRTSVLHSLYEDIQEMSASNKQQHDELKSYRDHDTFYKFLKQKLEDREQ
ncbi:uncharacterized protein LOC129219737 [Uloborus diversus]|uniref:uncharacterized protein LOC129219737 n=1 Tax=Uloborus diversus TaxID=327109 RepID=UPI002409E732|nr:uncharacterized protein LOC129219737 [Uloborus diversus]